MNIKRIEHLNHTLGIPRKVAANMSREITPSGKFVFNLADDGKDAELLIYEFIGYDWFTDGGMSATRFAEELSSVAGVDRLTIKINSPGGDVWDGMSIYNQLLGFKPEVRIVVDGVAASAASLIAMAGDVVEAYETSQLMIHDSWTVAMGNEQDLRETADTLAKIDGQLAAVYAGKSGKIKEEAFRDIMDSDSYLTAKEAMEMGLIDGIISPPKRGDDMKDTTTGTPKARYTRRRMGLQAMRTNL